MVLNIQGCGFVKVERDNVNFSPRFYILLYLRGLGPTDLAHRHHHSHTPKPNNRGPLATLVSRLLLYYRTRYSLSSLHSPDRDVLISGGSRNKESLNIFHIVNQSEQSLK